MLSFGNSRLKTNKNMKKISFGLLMLIALGTLISASCTQSEPQTVKHVVLISLDGSRPEFYMDSSWPAPVLQKLRAQGVYASKGIQSVFPSVTYPSHTTLITGAYPATHGIYYNAPFEGAPGHWYWNAHAIKCPTLWDAVKDAGMTSGSVFWPVTVDAPINYCFPVRRPEKGEEGNLLTIKYPYITPKDLLEELEKKTGKKITESDLTQVNFGQSKTIAALSNFIIKTYKPDLMAIHLVGLDHQEHSHGTDSPQLRAMLSVTDSLVGTILEAIKDAGIEKSTAVIITGDHGHTDTKATFAPNVYLARHHLLTRDSWRAIFNPAGGSAFLYLKNKDDKGVLDSIVTILKHTPEYAQGDFRMFDRATLDKMGVNPEVSLGLAMKEGIAVRKGISGKPLEVSEGPVHSTHGYDPVYPSMHTAFIAVGAGIGDHKDITGMGIKDVAPLVAHLLGLKFNAHDGVLIPGILADN